MAEIEIMGDTEYRYGRTDDLQKVLDIAVSLDWDCSLQLLQDIFESCPKGFHVAETKNIEYIGFCMTTMVGTEGIVCYFWVMECFRKKGIGKTLLQKSLQALGDVNVILFSAKAAVPYYKCHFRFQAVTDPCLVVHCHFVPDKSSFKGTTQLFPSVNITRLKDISFQHLKEYDTKIHIVNRHKRLEWFRNLEHSVAAVTPQDEILGYGCLSPMTPDMFKLGPIYAETSKIAKLLIWRLISNMPDGFQIRVSFFQSNMEAVAILEGLGAKGGHIDELLYRKYHIQVPIEKVYCISTVVDSFA